jgi:hypothetical protein
LNGDGFGGSDGFGGWGRRRGVCVGPGIAIVSSQVLFRLTVLEASWTDLKPSIVCGRGRSEGGRSCAEWRVVWGRVSSWEREVGTWAFYAPPSVCRSFFQLRRALRWRFYPKREY